MKNEVRNVGSKGVNSLLRTLELIDELQQVDAFTGSVLGVLPFRDRWTGRTQAKQSQKSIETMREIVGEIPILPSILESEQFKRSIDQNKLPTELGHPQLEYPGERVKGKGKYTCVSPSSPTADGGSSPFPLPLLGGANS